MATTATDKNKELARRDIEEVWNEENYDAIDELYADDFVLHDPTLPEEIRGPDGLREFVKMYNTSFPGSPSITIEELIAEDDMVMVRWMGRGAHEAEFMGIEPTHEEIEVAGMTLARIEDGKFAEGWSSYDALGLMQQIGAVQPPEA